MEFSAQWRVSIVFVSSKTSRLRVTVLIQSLYNNVLLLKVSTKSQRRQANTCKCQNEKAHERIENVKYCPLAFINVGVALSLNSCFSCL